MSKRSVSRLGVVLLSVAAMLGSLCPVPSRGQMQPSDISHPVLSLYNNAMVRAVAFSSDGQLLIAAGDSKTLTAWAIATGKPSSEFISPGRDAGAYLAAVLLPDNRTLAVKEDSGRVRLWDLKQRLPVGEAFKCDRTDSNLAISPSGKVLAVPEGRGVLLRDATTFDIIQRFQSGDESGVHIVAFSHDGKYLACGNTAGKITLWEVATGKQQQVLAGRRTLPESIEFSRDQLYLVTRDVGREITVWDLKLGKMIWTQQGEAVAISADSTSVLIRNRDSAFAVVDIPTGKRGRIVPTRPLLARAMTVSPDGRQLAVGTDSGAVYVWNICKWLRPD